MGLFRRTWLEHLAAGDAAREEGERPLALQRYKKALLRFDGSADEKSGLVDRIRATEAWLLEKNLIRAEKQLAAGAPGEALSALESALEYASSEEHRHTIAEMRKRARLAKPKHGILGNELKQQHRTASDAPIQYLVTARHHYTMTEFLDTWGQPIADQIEVISYERLSAKGLRGGLTIFSDLERLRPAQRALLKEIFDELTTRGHCSLNHPTRALHRYELLRALHQRGQNQFNIYRLDEMPEQLNAPVFVRHATEHEGSFSDLITDVGQLEETVGDLLLFGFDPESLVIVEYCETVGEDGLYRKYSAFRVGDRIIPRHLIFGHEWVLKYPDLCEPETLQEEWRYLETNPHEEQLFEIFEQADIDYGRIDYGLLEEKIQVWEINTNPIVMLQPERYNEVHLPAQEWFAPLICDAFRALVPEKRTDDTLEVAFEPEIVRRVTG